MENFGALLLWGILIGSYFIPTIIAAGRKHHNSGAIFALNMLLGWTGLGWIGALVWSCTSVPDK